MLSVIVYAGENKPNTVSWKLVKDDEHIKAWVEEGSMSEIKGVKVESIVEASLSQLVSIIKDAEHHKDWVFLNNDAYTLSVQDYCHWTYYGQTDAPWPVTDRDCIVESELTQDTKTKTVIITGFAHASLIPENEDYVRIKKSKSMWKLTPLENGKIDISFELKVDAGGNIPKWLANMAVSKGPYKTMQGLIKIIDEGRYKNEKLSYIVD